MRMLAEERYRIETMTDPEQLRQEAVRLFHQLWGKGQAQHEGYDKDMWCMLQIVLNRLGVNV